MNWRKGITRAIAETSSLVRICSGPYRGLRILLYHAVGSQIIGDSKKIFSISSDLFEKQMKELTNNYNGAISLLSDILHPKQMEGIAVTFDDGYKDNLTEAVPILLKYGIPFAIFITTAYVKSGEKLYLNGTDIRTLSDNSLVTIGSHGMTHVPLTECDDRKLRNELESSKHFLEDLTGKQIESITYPHGAVDCRVRDAAENAGYRIGATSRFGINNRRVDWMRLSRTCILGCDSLRVFRQKLHGDWDWYRWRQYLRPLP